MANWTRWCFHMTSCLALSITVSFLDYNHKWVKTILRHIVKITMWPQKWITKVNQNTNLMPENVLISQKNIIVKWNVESFLYSDIHLFIYYFTSNFRVLVTFVGNNLALNKGISTTYKSSPKTQYHSVRKKIFL